MLATHIGHHLRGVPALGLGDLDFPALVTCPLVRPDLPERISSLASSSSSPMASTASANCSALATVVGETPNCSPILSRVFGVSF